MHINLRDGMFLGKEELLRIRDFQEMEHASKNSLFNSWRNQFGPFGVYADSIGVKDMRSTIGGFFFHAETNSGCGRAVVGWDVDGKIALPTWTLNDTSEAFLSANQLPTHPNLFSVVSINSLTTNYEMALATVNSDGTVVIDKGWSYVSYLFRTVESGKPSLIKTEGGQLLTVTEVREVSAVGYLTVKSSASIVEEEDVKFMFMQTVSPFSNEEPCPLYVYNSAAINVRTYSIDQTTYKEACEEVFDNGSNIPIAIWISGLDKKLELLRPDYFDEVGAYTLLDTVRDNQIANRHIKDGVITKNKLSFSPNGFGNFVEDTEDQEFTALIEPDSVCVFYSQNNIENRRYIKVNTPEGVTDEYCVTHPSRVIMKSEQDDTATYELGELFRRDAGNVSVLFMEGSTDQTSGERMEIFDIYWLDKSSAMVIHTPYNLNI